MLRVTAFSVFVISFAVFSFTFTEPTIADSKSADGAMVYIISPTKGAISSGMVAIRFGLKGMGVAPAGVEKENTGHHHLLIDNTEMLDMTMPMGSSKNLRHFGGGQTEVTLELPKGKHTIQLILGDDAHVPHSPPVVAKKVTFMVKKRITV